MPRHLRNEAGGEPTSRSIRIRKQRRKIDIAMNIVIERERERDRTPGHYLQHCCVTQWPSTNARRLLAALLNVGWHLKRQSGSHRTLSRNGYPDFVFAFHDGHRGSRESRVN